MRRPTRLTVVEHVYCQEDGAQPILANFTHARWLKTDEQPYIRLRAKSVDYGWLAKPSLLIVKNVSEGPLVLEVGRVLILPGESARFTPLDRPSGMGEADVYAFPE